MNTQTKYAFKMFMDKRKTEDILVEDTAMNIETQFNSIAKEYDGNRKKFIPCFDDFYDNSTKFILSILKHTKKIINPTGITHINKFNVLLSNTGLSIK